MASAPHIMLPTPVGGTPVVVDGAPCVLFVGLYALLVPFAILRFSSSKSRTMLIFGVASFVVEHVVIWGLRAWQAFGTDEVRTNIGLLLYIQISLGGAFIILAGDTVLLLRVLLVRTTAPPDLVGDAPYLTSNGMGAQRARFWTRRATDVLRLCFLLPILANIIAGMAYGPAMLSQKAADILMNLRYASGTAAVFLIAVVLFWTFVARSRVPSVREKPAAADRLIQIFSLLLIIGLYRLGILHLRVSSLLGKDTWASQQSNAAKALFFVFHALPEWAAAALLLLPNTRALFSAGFSGDWRSRDGEKTCAQARKARRERRMQDTTEMAQSFRVIREV